MPAEKIPQQNWPFLSLQSSMISQTDKAVAQRISSAGLHKIKELKNAIFDLQNQIEAASLENQGLKELQDGYWKAIGRYKSSGSHLMNLLAQHYKEVKCLRKLLTMSQKDERNTSQKLRTVEAELQKARDALQTLHLLSEDKALAEREELAHRLSVLTEKMELNDKRIQGLEKQLKLNSSTFSHQLASENKKAVEAGIMTMTLQMEMNSLHQKIKEKERQLSMKNIYANRMLQIPKGRSEAAPQEEMKEEKEFLDRFRKFQGPTINRSVQVDKESFRSLLLSQNQTQERGKHLIQLIKEKNSAEDKNQNTEANEASTDAQCRTEELSTKTIPKPESVNGTQRAYLQEGKLLMEGHTCLEFMKGETGLLKWELKNLMKPEQTLLRDSGKKNNQEEYAVEDYETEAKKAEEELSNSEKAGSECVTSDPRTIPPLRLRKKYIFSEDTENLHHGLCTSGRKAKKGSLGSHSHAADSKVPKSSGLHEPSCHKVSKARQKNNSTEEEGSAHMTFAERKEVF